MGDGFWCGCSHSVFLPDERLIPADDIHGDGHIKQSTPTEAGDYFPRDVCAHQQRPGQRGRTRASMDAPRLRTEHPPDSRSEYPRPTPTSCSMPMTRALLPTSVGLHAEAAKRSVPARATRSLGPEVARPPPLHAGIYIEYERTRGFLRALGRFFLSCPVRCCSPCRPGSSNQHIDPMEPGGVVLVRTEQPQLAIGLRGWQVRGASQ